MAAVKLITIRRGTLIHGSHTYCVHPQAKYKLYLDLSMDEIFSAEQLQQVNIYRKNSLKNTE
jgi:hypothetical protein